MDLNQNQHSMLMYQLRKTEGTADSSAPNIHEARSPDVNPTDDATLRD
jgi:hypothetical protein